MADNNSDDNDDDREKKHHHAVNKCPNCGQFMDKAGKTFDRRTGSKAIEIVVNICHKCEKAYKGDDKEFMPDIYWAIMKKDYPKLNISDIVRDEPLTRE